MRTILYILIAVGLISSCSNDSTPSTAVTSSFEKMFPTATKVTWEKEDKNEWESEFLLDGNKVEAKFAEDGTWVKTERDIQIADLPKAVADSIKMQYLDWEITEAEKNESTKHGIIYKADLKKGLMKKDVKYTENGLEAAD